MGPVFSTQIRHRRPLRSLEPYAILAAGLLATAAAAAFIAMSSRARDLARFENAIQATEDRIAGRVDAYIALLRGASGFIVAFPGATRPDFQKYVGKLELPLRYPGVQGVGITEHVRAEELPAFVEQMKRVVGPGYHVWPEAPRPDYHPIVFLEPLDRRNLAAIGFDMFTEAARRAAMEQARDTGLPAMSGKVTLVQEIDPAKQAGFLIYLPIYVGGVIPDTVDERRAQLRGFAYSPFRAGDLFAGIFGSEREPRLTFKVYDGDVTSEQHLLYDSSRGEERRTAELQQTSYLTLAGRTWTLLFESRPVLESTSRLFLIPLTALGGLLLTLVLYFLSHAQRSARERVERSNERFRSLVEATHQIVFVRSPNGRAEEDSPTWRRFTGQTVEEYLGMGWLSAIHPDDQSRDLTAWNRTLHEGEPYDVEHRLRKPDGTYTPMHVSAAPVLDRNGAVGEFIGTSTDIGAQKRADENLRFLSEATRILTEGLEDPTSALHRVAELASRSVATICVIDQVLDDGSLKRVAMAHREPRFEPELHRARQFVPRTEPGSPIANAIASGEALLVPQVTPEWLDQLARSAEHRATLSDLAPRTMMVLPVRARAKVLGVITLASSEAVAPFGPADLSMGLELAHRTAVALDNSRLFQQTVEAERRSRFLAEASAMLSASLDYQATLERVAQLAVPALADWCTVDMLGEDGSVQRLAVAHQDPRKVRLARELTRIRPIDLRAKGGVGKVLRTGEPEWIPDIPPEALDALAHDPEQQHLLREIGLRSLLCVPLLSRGKVLGAISFILAESGRKFTEADRRLVEDLARRAALSVENARLYSESQNAVRARDEFLSIASHELKTPLTSLGLQLDLIERSLDPEARARAGGRFAPAKRQVNRLGALVESLLDVSRIATGRMNLELGRVDLVELVHEAVERLREVFDQAGSPLKVEVGGPVVGDWDGFRLDQAVVNLLTNAAKYGAGRPVQVRVWREGSNAFLSVRDEGIGIAPESSRRIFGRFERAVSERHYGGLGLGLYITHQIIEAHGGEIRVDSELGKGATFEVRLPLHAVQPSEA